MVKNGQMVELEKKMDRFLRLPVYNAAAHWLQTIRKR